MTEQEKEYARIIGKNLRRIAYEHDKTQVQIAKDLKQPTATVSSWMNGTRIPRIGKIDLLCDYFGVSRSDIMEPYKINKPSEDDKLLQSFHSLNNTGKEKLLDYLSDLLDNPKYTGKKSSVSEVG